MSFNFLIDFLHTVDKNGSMTWSVSNEKILILYYFNRENIDLEYIVLLLNFFACQQRLDGMETSIQNAKIQSNFKRIEFYVKNNFY